MLDKINIKDAIELGLLLAAFVWFFVEKNANRKKKPKSLESNAKINEQIYKVIINLCHEYSCLRVFLCQFSNGEYFFTGQSMQYITITHEWVNSPRVEKRGAFYQKVMIEQLSHRVISQVMRDGIKIELVHESIQDIDLKQLLNSFSAKTAVYFKITDGKNNMVAMLVMHWNHNHPVSDSQIFDIRTHSIRELENIFIENL